MGENSKIAWTHHTFNPWVGCQRVSPGCEHSYAEALDKRWGGALVDEWLKERDALDKEPPDHDIITGLRAALRKVGVR